MFVTLVNPDGTFNASAVAGGVANTSLNPTTGSTGTRRYRFSSPVVVDQEIPDEEVTAFNRQYNAEVAADVNSSAVEATLVSIERKPRLAGLISNEKKETAALARLFGLAWNG